MTIKKIQFVNYVKKINEEENDELFKKWIQEHGAICPRCRLACQRIDGSNWIYCNPNVGGCGCGFCYKCNREVDHYSPHILRGDCSQSPNEK